MGICLAKSTNDEDDSVHKVQFTGGNVHLITSKESWDQKLTEAAREKKIVSYKIPRVSVVRSDPKSICKVPVAFLTSVKPTNKKMDMLLVKHIRWTFPVLYLQSASSG